MSCDSRILRVTQYPYHESALIPAFKTQIGYIILDAEKDRMGRIRGAHNTCIHSGGSVGRLYQLNGLCANIQQGMTDNIRRSHGNRVRSMAQKS